jgi:hypothetical protein
MLHKLLCFLIFTPEAKKVYQPFAIPNVEKNSNIAYHAQKHYFNEYFSNLKSGHEKLVMVSSIVYNSNLYQTDNTTLNTSIYFQNVLDQDIDILVGKMITSHIDNFEKTTKDVIEYDIVEYYTGNYIPNEEKILTNNYDNCMIVNL